jgi:quercetin dioxygenase-like cupin family protein
MLEQVFPFRRTDAMVGEKVVDKSRLVIAHRVIPPGLATPRHQTDADVHLIVVRGVLTLLLADQEAHAYEAGSIVAVPCGAEMEIRNTGADALEFFPVKVPS